MRLRILYFFTAILLAAALALLAGAVFGSVAGTVFGALLAVAGFTADVFLTKRD